jgi:hypothetical protein
VAEGVEVARHYIIQIVSQDPCYYAGSKRLVARKAERTTHLKGPSYKV